MCVSDGLKKFTKFIAVGSRQLPTLPLGNTYMETVKKIPCTDLLSVPSLNVDIFYIYILEICHKL